MSKQNLNMSFWCIWHIDNHWKHIRNEKVMASKSKGGEKIERKQITKHFGSEHGEKLNNKSLEITKVKGWKP